MVVAVSGEDVNLMGFGNILREENSNQGTHNFIEQDQSNICFSVLKRPHPRVSSMLRTLA